MLRPLALAAVVTLTAASGAPAQVFPGRPAATFSPQARTVAPRGSRISRPMIVYRPTTGFRPVVGSRTIYGATRMYAPRPVVRSPARSTRTTVGRRPGLQVYRNRTGCRPTQVGTTGGRFNGTR